MKIKAMGFNELIHTKAKIVAEIELRMAKERRDLVEALGRFEGISTASRQFGNGSRGNIMKGKKLAPLYRNPKDPTQSWAGRGNRPRWLKAAIKGGKKLEAFAIR